MPDNNIFYVSDEDLIDTVVDLTVDMADRKYSLSLLNERIDGFSDEVTDEDVNNYCETVVLDNC